jgi:hypothetical protein
MRTVNQAFRLYVEPGQLESTIAFYEGIQRKPCDRRIVIADAGIEVAIVGGFILLAGNAQALAPVRDAQAVLMVDSLDEFAPWLQANGAAILHGPRTALGGRHLTARNPDGLVVEYYGAAEAA